MTHRFMIEGVIFSIDGDFPSEIAKCTQLFEGEAKTPLTIDGPLLKQQLKGMQIRFVQRDWDSFEILPSEAKSLVDSFIDFVTRGVAGLIPEKISSLLSFRFPNTGDASAVDLEELE